MTPINKSGSPIESVELSHDRLYWAVLDAAGWSGAGELPVGLIPILADELPVPIETLHAVAAPLADGRVLVCACPHTLLEAVEPKTLRLTPQSVPDSLGLSQLAPDPRALNVLIGPFEPVPLRARRRSLHLYAAATCLLCTLLIAAGLFRRAHHENQLATQATTTAKSLLAQHTADNREQSLTSQVQAMRSIADAARRARPATDAAASLESMLKAWPTSVPSKPQSMLIASDGVSIGVVVEGDPAPFLKSLSAPPGFGLDEPRLTSVGAATRLSLHLHPTGGAK